MYQIIKLYCHIICLAFVALIFPLYFLLLGCTNKHSAKVKCHYVGHSEHEDAWSVWFSGKGKLESAEPFCFLIFCYSYLCMHELEQVFAIFEDLGISVDCVATSEVSISVSLDPSKIWSRELIQQVSAFI